MDSYQCAICGHVYNPAIGEKTKDVAPGVDFTTLPADWTCPVCLAGKSLFKKCL